VLFGRGVSSGGVVVVESKRGLVEVHSALSWIKTRLVLPVGKENRLWGGVTALRVCGNGVLMLVPGGQVTCCTGGARPTAWATWRSSPSYSCR
jgi:hypothetical protein